MFIEFILRGLIINTDSIVSIDLNAEDDGSYGVYFDDGSMISIWKNELDKLVSYLKSEQGGRLETI